MTTRTKGSPHSSPTGTQRVAPEPRPSRRGANNKIALLITRAIGQTTSAGTQCHASAARARATRPSPGRQGQTSAHTPEATRVPRTLRPQSHIRRAHVAPTSPYGPQSLRRGPQPSTGHKSPRTSTRAPEARHARAAAAWRPPGPPWPAAQAPPVGAQGPSTGPARARHGRNTVPASPDALEEPGARALLKPAHTERVWG